MSFSSPRFSRSNLLAIFTIVAVTVTLAGCANLPSLHNPVATGPEARLTFQNGQTASLRIDTPDPALQSEFLKWVRHGIYTSTPVYRQLPGIFVLTGKPRLAGRGFVQGRNPSVPEPKEARTGQVGLVVHSDGSVGPELILIYGQALTTCCEAPANIRIGTIVEGKSALKSVQRGDNLLGISILKD